MKILKTFLLATSIVLLASACNCESKSDTWSDAQEEAWKSRCMTFMEENGVEKKNAVDFCDCMFEKTSEKYTPEEAEGITAEEERKLWNECDYNW